MKKRTTLAENGFGKMVFSPVKISFGKIKFSVSSSSDIHSLEIPESKIFDGKYKTIAVTKEVDTNSSSSINLYLKESSNDRLIINKNVSLFTSASLDWATSNILLVASSSKLSLDEFRVWTDALDDNIITNHTKQPDSIAGNNYTASSEDMLVRFDFEYPQNRFESSWGQKNSQKFQLVYEWEQRKGKW